MTAEETAPTGRSDTETLLALNEDYIRSVQTADSARFDEILAPEFYCTNPDGTLVNRAEFLAQLSCPVTIFGLRATDVMVRLFDDFAIIHARTSYALADGRRGFGRYTDVWTRQDGHWLAVSAHVTRLST
jgi:hypothetical protein